MLILLCTIIILTYTYQMCHMFIQVWDSGYMQLNVYLFRLYLNSIVGALIIAFSYYLLANPYLLAEYPSVRNALELTLSGSYKCRMDEAANNLFLLVLSSFATNLISVALYPIGLYLTACISRAPFVKPEFDAAAAVVSLFSFLSMILLSLPFAPLSLFFAPVCFFIRFQWQYLFTKHWYAKPVKPWKEQRASFVFTMFYMISLVVICLPTSIFFLNSPTFPKACTIQDEFIHLCSSNISSTDNTCILDTSSLFYTNFRDEAYPAIVCDTSCGPFINDINNVQAFKDAVILGSASLSNFIDIVFNYSPVSWGLAVLFFIYALQQRNTIYVNILSYLTQESHHTRALAELKKENERLERKLTRLRSIEQHNGDDLTYEDLSKGQGNKESSAEGVFGKFHTE